MITNMKSKSHPGHCVLRTMEVKKRKLKNKGKSVKEGNGGRRGSLLPY